MECNRCGKKSVWCKKLCLNCYMSDYRKNNKDKVQRYNKSWRERNPQRAHINNKKGLLKHNYGITLEKYNEIFEDQGGVCAICNTKTQKDLSVDHDHKTGEIRALLCAQCNFGLGNFKDNIELLKKAINYKEEAYYGSKLQFF